MSYCKHCGQELPDATKFCPGCGAPVEQAVKELTPSAPAQEPRREEPRKGRGRRIALWCLGGVLLVAALAVAMTVRAAWPGEFTSEQLEKIQANAQRRIGTVLETLGHEDAVEAEVVITEKVEREECDEHILCLERDYDINFNLTTNGSLSGMDKAAIMVLMEDFYWTVDYGGKYKSNSSSGMDLNAFWNTHKQPTAAETIMGVTIPMTDYSWSAHSEFEIDGSFCMVALDRVHVFGTDDGHYSTEEVMAYILARL